MSADTSRNTTGLKRKRVSQACHSCRSMKSKCDGNWPECSRCKGYGYLCVYGSGKKRNHQHLHDEACVDQGMPRGQGELREAISEYETLMQKFLPKLPSPKEQDDARHILARLKAANRALLTDTAQQTAKIPAVAQTSTGTGTGSASNASPTSPSCRQTLLQAERFLGEVSDVRFFNLVKQVIQNQLGSIDANQGVDSYEQDGDVLSPKTTVDRPNRLVKLPKAEQIASFTQVYFSTVHLAFPFIPQTLFMRSIREAETSLDDAPQHCTTLALIYVILAIGAYYTSLPGQHEQQDKSHEAYYLQALSLVPPAGTDRSIEYVCLLLAQCFYLLAVCRTDSCWVTLGQTVRTAQSIGLHIEQAHSQARADTSVATERRRRVWSCIYVLDRLVSLQLGRPPAIHEDYYNVPLPSRLGDSDIDWDADQLPAKTNFAGPSIGDYHIALISFSDIISQVLRDLCSAKASPDLAGELAKTKALDQQILQWKFSLPRTLRFDLGHAFEKDVLFKRQRSMFAIKYHHLRALIHRPYLCYPVLRNVDTRLEETPVSTNWLLVSMYEKTCISEARETARLLHSISSEKDLVQDFPWWQMISCLILAGSILLVSSIFTEQAENVLDGLEAASTYDDAETCLRAFEALGANSTGARIARDMMERLKEYGQKWKTVAAGRQPRVTANVQDFGQHGSCMDMLSSYRVDSAAGPSGAGAGAGANNADGSGGGGGGSGGGDQLSDMPALFTPTPSAWPPEIVDSMAWSIQFLGAGQPRME